MAKPDHDAADRFARGPGPYVGKPDEHPAPVGNLKGCYLDLRTRLATLEAERDRLCEMILAIHADIEAERRGSPFGIPDSVMRALRSALAASQEGSPKDET